MNKEQKYDYVIIGGGLAGMQLALAFAESIFFEDKSIAIIEPSDKIKQENSWSFWEDGIGMWEEIIYHQWELGLFKTKEKTFKLNLGTFFYKTVRSEDFFKYAKESIKLSTNIVWIKDRVKKVDGEFVIGELLTYQASIIFDSRVTADYKNDKKSITIQQHFKGWVIETNEPTFDDSTFTMMDYSLAHKNDCFFTYVLPFSEKKALIEATFFTKDLVDDDVYTKLLKDYISTQLNITDFKIIEKEGGNIPMSTFPFWEENSDNYLKIGTGGGWVKASSGYSFKSVEKKVAQILENLKHENSLDYRLYDKKYIFYDKIFLNVLFHENKLGKEIFEEMYSKNTIEEILNFLDEETTFVTELKIMNRFSKAPFLRALKKVIL